VTSYFETGSRQVYKRVHTADKTGQNCSVSNIFRTTENCLRLSRTHFTPQTRTRQDSLVLSVSAVWTRYKGHWKARSGLSINVNWTSFASVAAEALGANIDWKSAFSLQWGQLDPKFQVKGVAPPTVLHVGKTRINVLSRGINIWAEISLFFTIHAFDRRTAFSWLDGVACNARSAIIRTATLQWHYCDSDRYERSRVEAQVNDVILFATGWHCGLIMYNILIVLNYF